MRAASCECASCCTCAASFTMSTRCATSSRAAAASFLCALSASRAFRDHRGALLSLSLQTGETELYRRDAKVDGRKVVLRGSEQRLLNAELRRDRVEKLK